MKFDLETTVSVLSSTPAALRALLGGIPKELTDGPQGGEAWSPFDIVGHLIHAEETDWIPRARIIVRQGENRSFEPFDRFAQFEKSKGKTLGDLLGEFERLRLQNLDELRSWDLTAELLDLKGVHPEFGEVTLRQLLATWAVHDLNHIRQIVTAVARQYEIEVGPWKQYLSILN